MTTFSGSSAMPLILRGREQGGERSRDARQALRRFFKSHQRRGCKNTGLAHSAPNSLRLMRAFSMKSREPTSMDPTGAPSAFEKQNITESNFRVMSATVRLSAVAALKMRRRRDERGYRVRAHGRKCLRRFPAGRQCRRACLSALELDEAGLRAVVDVRPNHRLDEVPGENSIRRSDDAGQASGDGGNRGHFVMVDVRALVADDFHAGARPS